MIPGGTKPARHLGLDRAGNVIELYHPPCHPVLSGRVVTATLLLAGVVMFVAACGG